MRMYAAIVLILACAVPVTSALGQGEPFGTAVLTAVATRIITTNYGTRAGGLCHGFVYTVIRNVAYVVTAKHCVEEIASTKLVPGVQWRDLQEVVRLGFVNHSSGRAVGAFYSSSYDVIVLRSTFVRRPQSYTEACRCGYYNSFGRSQRIPILSVLSAGEGRPVPSAGYLSTDASGRYAVILPVSPGTSGSMVVDYQGRLVGIVWGEWSPVYPQGGAGYRAFITPAPAVMGLLKYAFDHDVKQPTGP